MPFVSKAQERACWAQYNRDKAAGKTPSWDCHEWAAASPAWADLPDVAKKSKSKKARSASPKPKKTGTKAHSKPKKARTNAHSKPKKTSSKAHSKPKVHIGPKGGRYIIKQGRKIYIKQ
jgi:hypothetical protein